MKTSTSKTKRPRVGQIVTFGRRAGERTYGTVIKVNRTRVKIEQLGSDRGPHRHYPAGTVWTVPFALIYDNKGAPLASTRREASTPPTRRSTACPSWAFCRDTHGCSRGPACPRYSRG